MKVLTTMGLLSLVLMTPALAADAAKPTVEQFAWMTGRWVGEGLGGKVEEMFSPPTGGQMVGHFRSWDDTGPKFYEFECICTEASGIVYRVKHFNPDFHGWEEKEAYHSFPLLSVDGNTFRFDGLTIERVSPTEAHHVVSIKGKDGKVNDMTFVYRKVE